MNEGDEDMMSALDELGDMIRQQQQLRDGTFQQGQEQRQEQRQDQRQDQRQGQREDRQRGAPREGKPGQQQPNGNSFGDLRQNQQALRDRLNKLLEDLKSRGFGQNDQQGQGNPGQG